MRETDIGSRLSSNMFQNEAPDIEPNAKSRNKIFIILIIILLLVLVIFLIVFIVTKDNDDNESYYNPVPSKEDLNFTEEEHRILSREVATQSMVLATNNGGLPLKKNDQIVLFGEGTNNTIYGGWGSGEVYNRRTAENLSPVTILEGMENNTDKFIYAKNDIGYEIGIPGIKEDKNLTDEDIKENKKG